MYMEDKTFYDIQSEDKDILEFIKKEYKHCKEKDNVLLLLYLGDTEKIINLIEKQQKELNNIKEIEKSHKEENGKLRVELEQEKEKYKRLQNTEAFSECYISKDKIKNILDKFNKGEYHYIHDLMQEIQELLEEKQNVRL